MATFFTAKITFNLYKKIVKQIYYKIHECLFAERNSNLYGSVQTMAGEQINVPNYLCFCSTNFIIIIFDHQYIIYSSVFQFLQFSLNFCSPG